MGIAVGDLYQGTFVCQAAGQTVENVFMMRARTGLETQSQLNQAWRDFWSIYRAIVSSSCVVTELRLKKMTPTQLDGQIFQPNSTEGAGAAGSTPTNNVLALVTTHRTGTAGKKHRGRTYTFGLPAASLSDNENKASAGYLTLAQTTWDAILTAYGDATGTAALSFGIYSRVIGGTSPFTVAGWQAVIQCVPHAILGTQRRRREGVGI